VRDSSQPLPSFRQIRLRGDSTSMSFPQRPCQGLCGKACTQIVVVVLGYGQQGLEHLTVHGPPEVLARRCYSRISRLTEDVPVATTKEREQRGSVSVTETPVGTEDAESEPSDLGICGRIEEIGDQPLLVSRARASEHVQKLPRIPFRAIGQGGGTNCSSAAVTWPILARSTRSSTGRRGTNSPPKLPWHPGRGQIAPCSVKAYID
jgi:hypothetical protein